MESIETLEIEFQPVGKRVALIHKIMQTTREREPG